MSLPFGGRKVPTKGHVLPRLQGDRRSKEFVHPGLTVAAPAAGFELQFVRLRRDPPATETGLGERSQRRPLPTTEHIPVDKSRSRGAAATGCASFDLERSIPQTVGLARPAPAPDANAVPKREYPSVPSACDIDDVSQPAVPGQQRGHPERD